MDEQLLYEMILFLRRYLSGGSYDPEYEEYLAEDLLEKLEEIAEGT